MMIFRDTKLGIYLAAGRLAKETGEEKIVWLQRLAAVVTGHEPGPDLVDYFDLRRSEGQAWGVLDLLAKQQFNHEAQDLERKLSTVLLDCEQLVSWLKSQYGISAAIQSHAKEWLTLAQAAKYLADIVKEKTEEIDILQLGLAKRLRLSVLFADYVKVKPGGGFNSKDRITALTGLCDLVMNSAGDNFVKSLICGGRKDRLQSGAVVEYRGAKYTLYQFLTPPDWTAQEQLEWELSQLGPEPQKDPRFYFPGPFPPDCQIVVRPEALDDCAAALTDTNAPPADSPQPVKPSEALRQNQKKYSTSTEKRAAKSAVLQRIKEKQRSGEPWHQVTELRRYMAEQNIPPEKKGGLLNAVKEALQKEGIEAVTGKPPRF